MASNLYEVLELDKSASPEDIRKAYRKMALKTHPDRLPPDTSEADRQRANERFRLVNNAYEILNDERNRKLYDQHGVWPPNANMPSPEAGPSFTRTSRNMRRDGHSRPSPQPGPFSDPFFSDPFFQQGFPGPSFTFRDPFEIFSSVFGDMHVRSGFNDSGSFVDVHFPFGSSPFGSSPFGSSPFGSSPFGAAPFGGSPFGSSMNTMMGGGPSVRTHSSVSQFISAGSRSESQSVITRTVNGRTETITKKRDANGNEHVVYKSPEGERHVINGVEQPFKPSGTVAAPSRVATLPSPSSSEYSISMSFGPSQSAQPAVSGQPADAAVVPRRSSHHSSSSSQHRTSSSHSHDSRTSHSHSSHSHRYDRPSDGRQRYSGHRHPPQEYYHQPPVISDPRDAAQPYPATSSHYQGPREHRVDVEDTHSRHRGNGW